ncbi:MAG: DMT family transporter [Methylophilaceae bacterium]|nr:DMT family transporter [Methylophilaceae bacterium]
MIEKTSTKFFATFGLLFGAVSWGILWYPYRLLEQAGIPGVAASFYTFLVALVLGGLVFARHWRGLCALPLATLWLALAAGWTNLSYVVAVIDGEVMRIMLLFYLSPLWTLMLAHFWLKERTGKLGMIAIVASLAGAFVMLWQPASMLPVPQCKAEWLALSSGIGFAVSNVLTRKIRHLTLRVKSMAVWAGVVFMALIFLPFHAASFPSPETISAYHGLMMVGLGLVLICTTWLVQFGITHIPVTRASVIFLFEIVVAAYTSYWLAHETMALNEWLGGSLIILAAMIAARAEEVPCSQPG